MRKQVFLLILKAIVWRILITLATFAISLFVTKKLNIALNIMFLDMIIKTFIYFGYDLIWRKYVTDSSAKKC
jgi:uncharacterized membrane protein